MRRHAGLCRRDAAHCSGCRACRCSASRRRGAAPTCWGARWICGIRHRVVGAENIPSTPHIVMSKHSSTWETLALTLFFPPLAYVAKKELLSIPFFGWGFALASPITIDRKAGTDSMQQIAAQGRERFRQGFWIVIYPEGTRIRAGTRAKYKTGGARLAIELATPILPVAHNAGYLWPKGLFGKRPGTVTISFGKPISPRARTCRRSRGKSRRGSRREVARLGVPRARRLMAGLRLKDIFGGRVGRAPQRRGRSAAHRARRRQRRLPARPRAPALDRHADRLLGPHRARAALGVAARDRRDARRARRVDPAFARRMARAAARRPAARMEDRRADPLSRARAGARRARRAEARDRGRPPQPHRAASGGATTSGRSRRSSPAGCATRRSASCSRGWPNTPRASRPRRRS